MACWWIGFHFPANTQWQPTARNRGEPSQHEGAYWIGGYENYTHYGGQPGARAGDQLTGTMESNEFMIYSERISFLIGGGCGPQVGLQLIVDGRVVRETRGLPWDDGEKKLGCEWVQTQESKNSSSWSCNWRMGPHKLRRHQVYHPLIKPKNSWNSLIHIYTFLLYISIVRQCSGKLFYHFRSEYSTL